MSRRLFSRALAPALVVVCAGAAPVRADPTRSAGAPERFQFHDPIVFHNITLVPVSTEEVGPFERYTLLEEGLKKKSLRVRELAGNSDQAQVSAVQVRNTGPLAAFVLSGEMILGGKQDRILSNDTVIPNDGKWHQVEVFCVEQGRWQGRKMQFEGGAALAHAKLRKAAMSGSQGEVWAEVERKNAVHGTSSETQTYRRTVQNADLRRRVASHRQELVRQLPDARLSGFVFAVNDEVRVADMFTNPLLFADLQEKLLSAYILEALEQQAPPPSQRAKAGKEFDKAKAKAFYEDAKAAPQVGNKTSGDAVTFKKKKKGMVGTETKDKVGRTLKESYLAE